MEFRILKNSRNPNSGILENSMEFQDFQKKKRISGNFPGFPDCWW